MIGVNPGSLESHTAWATELSFDFPILVDEGAKVATEFGVVKENNDIQRTVFLIDKTGVIRWAEVGRPETEVILAAIDAL